MSEKAENLRNMVITDAVIEGNKMIAVDWLRSGLFRIDIVTDEVALLNPMKRNKSTAFLPRNVVQVGNSIFITSSYDAEIAEIHEDKVLYYEPVNGESRRISADSVCWKEKIWLIPQILDGDMFCFDTNHRKTHMIEEWTSEVKGIDNQCTSLYVIGHVDNILWILLRGTNTIISYDLEKGIIKPFHVPQCGRLYSGACLDNALYLIQEDNNNIVKFDLLNENVSCFLIQHKGLVSKSFSRIIQYLGTFYLVPSDASQIICVRDSKEICIPINSQRNNASTLYYSVIPTGDKLFFLPWGADRMLELELSTNKVREHYLVMGKIEYGNLLLSRYPGGIWNENTECGLTNLIQTI